MTEIGSRPFGQRARFRRPAVRLAVALIVGLAAVASLALAGDETRSMPRGPAANVEEAGAGAPADRPEVALPFPPAWRVDRHLGEGSASYYSDVLEGRPTASGQLYRGADLTAAHRNLPFGSRVRVTNLASGRSVVVRVNDRGPFARRHALDVSRAAAERLGIVAQGHAQVRLELLQ